MTHEEIRKLLGGYATNTLTETERRALMEAALDDQELFNALQDEEAFRDLLADAASREQVYQALAEKPARAWWRGGWMWGGVLAAAAAAALVILVVERKPPQPAFEQQVQVASSQEPKNEVARQQAPAVAPKVAAPAPALQSRRALKKAEPAPPPLPAAAPAEARPQAGAGSSLGALTAARDAAQAAPLRYDVLRRAADGTFPAMPAGERPKAGDAVRLRITPAMAGELTIDRVANSGQITTVLPAMAVDANTTYEVPGVAIELSSDDQRLRVILQANAAPVVTMDIPIGPN